jgi:hypothetical protein
MHVGPSKSETTLDKQHSRFLLGRFSRRHSDSSGLYQNKAVAERAA